MKFALGIALSLTLGVLLSLLPFQIYRSNTPTTAYENDKIVEVPPVTWLNFFRYPSFYESLVSKMPAGVLVTFAPLILLLQSHFIRGMKWSAIALTIEGLLLIALSCFVHFGFMFSHVNWMTGYTQWRYTPLVFVITGYGMLAGLLCIAWPWAPWLRQFVRE
jgi:hypothetical protein